MTPLLRDTLAEYGKQFGLSELSFGEQGAVHLQADSGLVIGLEAAEAPGPSAGGGFGRGAGAAASSADDAGEVLVFLRKPLAHAGTGLLRRALAKAHFVNGGRYPVQLGLVGEGLDAQLTVLTRLPARQFTPQALGSAVDFLTRWLDELSA